MPAPLRIKYTQEKEWLCMSEQEMTKADNRQRYIELGYNIAYYDISRPNHECFSR